MSYSEYTEACIIGDTHTVKRLDCEESRKANNYHAFILAAANGHLEVVKFLDCPEARKAEDYGAFKWAFRDKHTEIVDYLISDTPLLVIEEEMAKVF